MYSQPERQQEADRAVLEELRHLGADHGLPDKTIKDSLTTQILDKRGRLLSNQHPDGHVRESRYLAALSKGWPKLLGNNPTKETLEQARIFTREASRGLDLAKKQNQLTEMDR